MKSELKAVIFDLDGVLTDTAEYHYKGWKMLADQLGIPFDKEANEELKGIDRLASLNKILEKGNKTYTEEEKAQLCNTKNDYYKELIKSICEKDLLPGAENVLKELKRRNLKIGLASVSKNAFTVVESLKIAEYFDYIADAAKIAKGKPDPEIFITCANGLGVECESCLGVEDAAAGVEAIKGSNMIAVGIGEKEILSNADMVLGSLEDLNFDEIIAEYYLK